MKPRYKLIIEGMGYLEALAFIGRTSLVVKHHTTKSSGVWQYSRIDVLKGVPVGWIRPSTTRSPLTVEIDLGVLKAFDRAWVTTLETLGVTSPPDNQYMNDDTQ
jgi:hypothetical protein